MSYEEAKEALRYHACLHPDHENTKWQNGFLGSLRPYRGALDPENFHGVMEVIIAAAPHLQQERVDREGVYALWGMSRLAARWGLHPDGMLRRNDLISAEDQATLDEWLRTIDYAVMLLLGGSPLESALSQYDCRHHTLELPLKVRLGKPGYFVPTHFGCMGQTDDGWTRFYFGDGRVWELSCTPDQRHERGLPALVRLPEGDEYWKDRCGIPRQSMTGPAPSESETICPVSYARPAADPNSLAWSSRHSSPSLTPPRSGQTRAGRAPGPAADTPRRRPHRPLATARGASRARVGHRTAGRRASPRRPPAVRPPDQPHPPRPAPPGHRATRRAQASRRNRRPRRPRRAT